MRTSARLDGTDATGREGFVPREKLGVFAVATQKISPVHGSMGIVEDLGLPRENIVRHCRNTILISQGMAQREHQRRLAGPDWSE